MSEKLPRIDCQQLIQALERVGFVRKRQEEFLKLL
jgi:predicted RNA binding protein YcfA (HicA-like mRNA interferase family)